MRQNRQTLGIFRVESQFSRPNINLIFLKIIFLSEYQIRRTTFVNPIFKSSVVKKVYLGKMCPIFDDPASNCFTRYQKILWVCSLGSKNLLNFTCLTMKFHDRNYVSVYLPSNNNEGHFPVCKNFAIYLDRVDTVSKNIFFKSCIKGIDLEKTAI